MDTGDALFQPAHVEESLVDLHLVPAQCAELAHTQTMPVGEQDHGRIAMAIATPPLGGQHQVLDLPLGQVLPGSECFVGLSLRWNCPIFSGWHDGPGRV